MSDSTKTPPDQEARDRLVSDFTRNYLVEAGAGSGKTHSLAMRMAAGIASGAYTVEGMAAVTFTRKAAAELRGRFQEALEQRLRNTKGEEEQRRLRRALGGLERLFAGTIHAFCAHLLRERPVDAKVAPGFDELDDVDDVRLRRGAWREFVVERRAAGDSAMLDLLDAGVRPTELEAAFATVCQHEDVEFDRGSGDVPDAALVWPDVDEFWKKLLALKPPEFPEGTTCPVQRRFEELEGRLRLSRGDRPASLASFLTAWGKPTVIQKCWGEKAGFDKAHGKRVAVLVEDFGAAVVEPFLAAWRAYVHRLAMAVLIDARDYYAEVRRRHNVVNYVDLLRVAERMLRDCPHVLRALQAKYRWLFIDEFQDTDPIQARIFLMLAGDGRGGLRPGSLFVVGDPKQSIFRFRRADIDIYNQVAERIERTGGKRLALVANFRSLPGVCALANTVFPPLFAARTLPWSPPFEKLAPVRDEAEGGDGPRVATLTLPGAKKVEAVASEARAIAEYIQGEVSSRRRRYGDFLVLTRLKPRLSAFADALDEREIPVEVTGAGFFCKAPEVRALGLLLSALADPLDAVSLVGVLRGPLFGLSDPELFEYRRAGGRLELHARAVGEASVPANGAASAPAAGQASVPARVLGAMRELQGMLRLTWSLPLPAAVDRILEQTGWLALASSQPGGAPAGRLLQAIDRVRQVVEEGGGLADAADALDEEEPSNEAEALPLRPGRRDVVRLMNLHKAKGLEAPVVILADATSDYDFPLTVRVERSDGVARGHLRVAYKREQGHGATVVVGQPRDWPEHEAKEKEYVDAERLRLLYVASTRAEDLLIVCRSAEPKANRPWAEFAGFLAGVPEIAATPASSTGVGSPSRPSDPDVSPAARAAAAAARDAAHATARQASWASSRATLGPATLGPATLGPDLDSSVASSSDPGATGLKNAMNQDPAPREGASPGGAAWGSLVHGLLEHAVRHETATRGDLARLARWLTVESPELRPFIDQVLDLVDGLRTAPFWVEVRAASEVHVEAPFAVRVEPGQRLASGEPAALPTVVHGVIDLVYRADEGWRILDYKTDRLPTYDPSADHIVLDRHGPQLGQYRVAWEQVTGEKVADEGIVLVRGRRVAWNTRRPAVRL